jgi:alpha-tubulin suppressor-like RCC1 family protein
MKLPSHLAVKKSLSVETSLCAIVAAMVLAGGCSSPHVPDRSDQKTSVTAPHSATAQPSTPPIPERPSTVKHWGSFFGGIKGRNYDLETSPAALTVAGTVAEIGSSNSTEYALLTDGALYAWGLGTQGELGDGRLSSSFGRPVRVRFPAGVTIASIPVDVMPYDTALAVDTRGNVWGWGNNGGGELCLGNTRAYAAPVRLPFSHVNAVAGASNHALYDAGGTLYVCGQNVEGDLGDGSRASSTTAREVAGLDGSDVTELVAAFANSGALLANGAYYDWGYDANGQLGDGLVRHSSDVPVKVPLPDPVTQVAQGGSIWNNGQTLALLSDGSLWAWGDNWAGQLGDGSRDDQSSPVRFRPPSGVTYKSLATGSATSYAVSTTGEVYAWGVSFVGQVGDGSTRVQPTPVLVAFGAAAISSTANNVVVTVPGRA